MMQNTAFRKMLAGHSFCLLHRCYFHGKPQGTDILRFHLGRFCFSWFADCGECFLYFRLPTVKDGICIVKELRLSSAGNYFLTYEWRD